MTENSVFKCALKGALILGAESVRTGKSYNDPALLMFAGASAVAFFVGPNVADMIISKVFSAPPTNLENQVIELATSGGLVIGYDMIVLKKSSSDIYGAFKSGNKSDDTVMKLAEHVGAHFAGEFIESYLMTTFPSLTGYKVEGVALF